MERAELHRAVGRIVVTAAVVLALALPVVRDHDSFPLSTHPMYATARDRDETLVGARGIAADGTRSELSLDLVARTDDPLIAESVIENAIRTGAEGPLCNDIADRVARTAGLEHVATIELVTSRVDLVDFVSSGAVESEAVNARCDVPR